MVLRAKAALGLLRKGYALATLRRACVDIVARKGAQVILIKILEDANAVGSGVRDLRNLACHLGASALILANKSNGVSIERGVVHTRAGLFVLSLGTFIDCLNARAPVLHSTRAGLVVRVHGPALRESRHRDGLSLSALSRGLGVSSSMVTRYETQESDMSFDHAMKLYELLGFSITEASRTPFDILARREGHTIVTNVGDRCDERARQLARLIEADSLAIFENVRPKDIPSLSCEKFMELDDAHDLMNLIKQF